MKKGLVAAAVLLLAAGGAAAGWYYYNDQSWNLEYFQHLFEEEKRSVYVTDIATLMGRSSTVADRYAGVVEPQSTVSVQLESGRRVSEVKVKEGDTVKQGQLLFEYDLSSIERSLQTAPGLSEATPTISWIWSGCRVTPSIIRIRLRAWRKKRKKQKPKISFPTRSRSKPTG